MKFDVARLKPYKGLLFVDIERYLSAQYTDALPHCVIGGSQGAGKSTLMSQLEADAHGQEAADQSPLLAVPAALLVVDAQLGMTATARRDCLLLSLMGVRRLGVVVNKMDATGYSQARFDDVVRAFRAFSASLPLPEATLSLSRRCRVITC